MSSPGTCSKCSLPAAVLTPDGLCLTCAAVPETPASAVTSPFLPPASPSGAPTGTFGPGSSAAPTITQVPDGPTATGPAAGAGERLPAAPPGYDLLRRLGGGGMGVVYLAREQASERLVAMKYLRFPGDQGAFDRFVTELRVLAKLDHPNIVRVLAHDFLRADPFFTMEHVTGGPLSHALNGPMPAADAVRLIRSVAGAVAAAHAKDVIHRDLKPSNILLAADGTPKVADFGLAKRLDELDSVTRASGALGTPSYMPPEQVSQKLGTIGAWSDVYGLGATLYHLLTGRAPFVGDSNEDVILQVRTSAPPRPRFLNPAIPAGLEAIVLRCLEKNTRARYQDVPELLADLDRYEAGQTTAAPELTRARRAKLWAAANRAKLALAAGVLLLLGGALALGVMLSRPPKPRDYVAEYQKELKAGRSVTLVPAKGLPSWYEKPVGGVEVATDIGAEGACTISSVQHGTVVLLPHIDIARYSVEAEFMELRLPDSVRPNENKNQWCALLVGYGIEMLPNGGRLHSFFDVSFRDFDFGATVGQAGFPEHALCNAEGIVELPGRNPEPALGNAKHRVAFAPSSTRPGKWRKVKFAIEPERIQAFWREDERNPDGTERLTRFADLDAERIRACTARTQKTLTANMPNLGRELSAWSPQQGIAIWCARASFALRNVVVTPNP